MKISILQMPVAFARPDENIQTLRRMVEASMREEPDVLVLPELWRLGFYPQPIAVHADLDGQQSRAVLAELARKNGVNIVGGTVANRREGKIYNTCYIFDRTGTEVASYDKAHLFTPSGESADFAAGDNAVTFRLDGVLCGIAVCYDMRFPEFIRKLALEDLSVLFLPAAWPASRLSHWQILTRARAIENQLYVIAANEAGTDEQGNHLAGHSAILDPWGEAIAEADEGEAILTARLRPGLRQHIRETLNVYADRRPELY